jgi:hypothetical protein
MTISINSSTKEINAHITKTLSADCKAEGNARQAIIQANKSIAELAKLCRNITEADKGQAVSLHFCKRYLVSKKANGDERADADIFQAARNTLIKGHTIKWLKDSQSVTIQFNKGEPKTTIKDSKQDNGATVKAKAKAKAETSEQIKEAGKVKTSPISAADVAAHKESGSTPLYKGSAYDVAQQHIHALTTLILANADCNSADFNLTELGFTLGKISLDCTKLGKQQRAA